LDGHYYEPYIKSRYKNERKRTFPFRFLEDKYAPMMRVIMKYFTCEGRFSRLYTYHFRLLMHFTRVKMLNIAYFLFRNIEKMAYIVQKKPYPQKMSSIYHYSLIKIIVVISGGSTLGIWARTSTELKKTTTRNTHTT